MTLTTDNFATVRTEYQNELLVVTCEAPPEGSSHPLLSVEI